MQFDFTHPAQKFYKGEILREWEQWPDLYFQSREVERQLWIELDESASMADGEQAAMGSFMLDVLPKGYIEPKRTGGYKIVVQEVALAAYNSLALLYKAVCIAHFFKNFKYLSKN